MPTVKANLDTDRYVKVNSFPGVYILQSHRDTVRVVFSNSGEPVLGNEAFHELGGHGKSSTISVPYTNDDI